MRLRDLSRLAVSSRECAEEFAGFRANALVQSLNWPDDVVEQLLYDHADNVGFLRDYGHIDLSRVTWGAELVPVAEFCDMPTGASDGDCIEEYAADPEYWVSLRTKGIHAGVPQMWEERGTWKRPPILIDRALLDQPGTGLQVVEGRTRVGVLRGRHRKGLLVAEHHLAWVGCPSEEIVP
jgi:hypothetical protein